MGVISNYVCLRACVSTTFLCMLLALSRPSRCLATHEVTQSLNYISFCLPKDIVPKLVMKQKLIRSMPLLKLSFLATQDIKHNILLLHNAYISFWVCFSVVYLRALFSLGIFFLVIFTFVSFMQKRARTAIGDELLKK